MIEKIEMKQVRQRREFSSEVSKYLKYEPNSSPVCRHVLFHLQFTKNNYKVDGKLLHNLIDLIMRYVALSMGPTSTTKYK